MQFPLTNGLDDFGMVFILILLFLIVLAPVFIWNVTAKILKETKQNVTATNKVAQQLEVLNGKMDKLLANQEQHLNQPLPTKKIPLPSHKALKCCVAHYKIHEARQLCRCLWRHQGAGVQVSLAHPRSVQPVRLVMLPVANASCRRTSHKVGSVDDRQHNASAVAARTAWIFLVSYAPIELYRNNVLRAVIPRLVGLHKRRS